MNVKNERAPNSIYANRYRPTAHMTYYGHLRHLEIEIFIPVCAEHLTQSDSLG